MASQLADTCQPPPSKRLRGVSEAPEAVSECPGSCFESPIDDSNTFDCLDGKENDDMSENLTRICLFVDKNQNGVDFFSQSTHTGPNRPSWQIDFVLPDDFVFKCPPDLSTFSSQQQQQQQR